MLFSSFLKIFLEEMDTNLFDSSRSFKIVYTFKDDC